MDTDQSLPCMALEHAPPCVRASTYRVRVYKMTFDELFKDHSLTDDERTALVAYLASLRMLATLRALTPPRKQ